MNKTLYKDSIEIYNYSINEVLPSNAVKNALKNFNNPIGKTILVSIGKAAYAMAKEAINIIHVDSGIVITKYGHSKEKLNNIDIYEAGHPVIDENSLLATRKAIELCADLSKNDIVVMLISGGGSSLFESPAISLKELQDINVQLLKCGANINEINTIRKRLSGVKGGKFAKICEPAKVLNIVLSDVIYDPLDIIASGPTYPDNTTSNDALNIISKYNLQVSNNVLDLLSKDATKELNNIETIIVGNNEKLKLAAKTKAEDLGYNVIYVEKPLTCNIDEAEEYIKSLLCKYKDNNANTAIIIGGEITVNVKGNGLGGRNQELVLRLIKHIPENCAIFAIGSDGTDGPTDAAGAYADFYSNKDVDYYIENNDSYHYFEKYGGHIKTGPTQTNVCDLYCLLIKAK